MRTKKTIVALLMVALSSVMAIQAQEVTTLYFLENAPMRHLVNPAFQPVSEGYVNFTPLGYTSLWLGNNSLTPSDIIFNYQGKTVTALYPGTGGLDNLSRNLRRNTLLDLEGTLDLVSFGFRLKNKPAGYVHIGIRGRTDEGMTLPRDMFGMILGGGMVNAADPIKTDIFDLTSTGLRGSAYMEISGGYSHQINEHWTVGGKAKFLTGIYYAGLSHSRLTLDASATEWTLQGEGAFALAGPLKFQNLPEHVNYQYITDLISGSQGMQDSLQNLLPQNIASYLTPSGYGAAFDIGFTYKPIEQVQISAAINDLGFIYWNNALTYTTNIDTTFRGVDNLQYKDYQNADGTVNTNQLMDTVLSRLEGFANMIDATRTGTGFARMTNAKLVVGVDANFWQNRVGIGVVSKTRLVNNRIYEEVTFGAALRPCNWFNLAVSYSLLNNGKYSNIGAGLSFMPYDGINLTLAMDYIPTSYVKVNNNIPVPYNAKGLNVALGFSIVWGTNKKKDKDDDGDGVFNLLDVCPNTLPNVLVDELGCPIDSDGDGVPDYLDNCPNTPQEAYGLVDSTGCVLDEDHDGVPDYLDLCPHTPQEAFGYIDEHGCELDTDGDGVPDWRDSCNNTLPEAYGYIDEFGCDLDTDGDGVPDWKDRCPNTPKEAIGYLDEYGCELDTDGDGIPDWQDECPLAAGPAYNKGCPEVKKEIRNLLQKAMQGIQFETGKAKIKPASFGLLNQIAETFIDNPSYIIEVQGHTDNVGKDDFNMKLSDKRAKAVMEYLVNAGVPAERMTANGYGPTRPIADNTTAQGRALNRRVEFNITFEEVHYETVLEHVDSTLYQQHLDSIQAQTLDTIAAPQE